MIACPYAFGLAAPLAIRTAVSASAMRGMLIKNGRYFEVAHQLDTIVFYKTGVLTKGTFRVTQVMPLVSDYTAEQVLQLAAAAEQSSEHPLALAIISHAEERKLSIPSARQSESLAGQGVWAEWEDKHVLVGSPRLMREQSVEVSAALARFRSISQTIYGWCDGDLCGSPKAIDWLDRSAR
jgi:P-type E1-E2 ATPase